MCLLCLSINKELICLAVIHSDTSINNTAPQPVAKQKQASGSSAASSVRLLEFRVLLALEKGSQRK